MKLLLFNLFLIPLICYSQQISLEREAVKYLCLNHESINNHLSDDKIYFKDKTINIASSIYHVADCLGDFNLFTNESLILNKLDSLNIINEKRVYDSVGINYSCNFFDNIKKISFLNVITSIFKKPYFLEVYRAIEYNDNYYVQMEISDKKRKYVNVIVVIFDKTFKAVNHCNKIITYHY